MAYSTPSCMHACVVHMALLRTLSILLLASMLVPAGSAEEPQPPSVYRFDLIHVDANAGLTREELISRAVDRTHLREAMLSAAAQDTDSAATSSPTLKATAHVSQQEYLMELQIGTPPKPFHAVADTGSDLVWTKNLTLCNRSSSSTLIRLACPSTCTPNNSKSCTANTMCDTCEGGMCFFKKTYGGQKTATGFVVNETLTMSPGKTGAGAGAGAGKEVKIISLGCATVCGEDVLPESADGLIGLSRGPKSFLSQLDMTNPKFSYCLNNPLTPKEKSLFKRLFLWWYYYFNEKNDKSSLWFGGDLSLRAGVQSTALVHVQGSSVLDTYKYYVEVVRVSIGKQQPELLPLKKKSKENGVGVMFVDSGCSYTLLEPEAFGVLKKQLVKDLTDRLTKKKGADRHLVEEDQSRLTCFKDADSKEKPKISERPEMVLYFYDGAKMRLPWDNYMIETDSAFCLSIRESSTERSVLGNYQQHNIRMLYDLTKGSEKLSFVPDDCTKYTS